MSRGDLFIVDDTPANLGLLSAILRDAGYAVRAANSGKRALAAVREQPPELVLLDVNMPEMNGYQVCEALKALTETATIPVIFLSALDEVEDKLNAFRVGGVDYVTKPFAAPEVLARVETQLKIARLRRELEEKNRALLATNQELQRARSHAEQIFAALSDLLEGTVLDDRYRLERRIGTGASAAVYRAARLDGGPPVAVKVLRPHPGGRSTAQALAERATLSRVAHDNAVVVEGGGVTPAGIGYVVMELLEGRTLADELVSAGRLGVGRTAAVFVPVAAALAAAHDAGVLHRDVKPANIFLHRREGTEVVKVVDFGVARVDDVDVEQTGASLVGTPVFMAPERLLGRPSDGRADVYSFGATLHLALAGDAPFRSDTLGGLLVACLHESPRPLGELRPDVPAALEALVLRALAKDPRERPTMRELSATLPAACADAPRFAELDDDDDSDLTPIAR